MANEKIKARVIAEFIGKNGVRVKPDGQPYECDEVEFKVLRRAKCLTYLDASDLDDEGNLDSDLEVKKTRKRRTKEEIAKDLKEQSNLKSSEEDLTSSLEDELDKAITEAEDLF